MRTSPDKTSHQVVKPLVRKHNLLVLRPTRPIASHPDRRNLSTFQRHHETVATTHRHPSRPTPLLESSALDQSTSKYEDKADSYIEVDSFHSSNNNNHRCNGEVKRRPIRIHTGTSGHNRVYTAPKKHCDDCDATLLFKVGDASYLVGTVSSWSMKPQNMAVNHPDSNWQKHKKSTKDRTKQSRWTISLEVKGHEEQRQEVGPLK